MFEKVQRKFQSLFEHNPGPLTSGGGKALEIVDAEHVEDGTVEPAVVEERLNLPNAGQANVQSANNREKVSYSISM